MRTVQPQRQPNHDLLYAVFAYQLAQSPHVLVPINALQRTQRLRHAGLGIGDSESYSGTPVIDGENRPARARAQFGRGPWHTSSIPGSSSTNMGCFPRNAHDAEKFGLSIDRYLGF